MSESKKEIDISVFKDIEKTGCIVYDTNLKSSWIDKVTIDKDNRTCTFYIAQGKTLTYQANDYDIIQQLEYHIRKNKSIGGFLHQNNIINNSIYDKQD